MQQSGARVWVKVQLRSDHESAHVGEILAYWRSLRGCTMHLIRAIRMYYALTQGDTSLLSEYFPFLGDMNRGAVVVKPQPKPAQVIESPAKSEAEDIGDLLDSLFG